MTAPRLQWQPAGEIPRHGGWVVVAGATAPQTLWAPGPVIEGTLGEMAQALETITVLMRAGAEEALPPIRQRLRWIAIQLDTGRDPDRVEAWAADWMEAVTSGLPGGERYAAVARAYRAVVSPAARPADRGYSLAHRLAFDREAA